MESSDHTHQSEPNKDNVQVAAEPIFVNLEENTPCKL